MTCNGLCLKHKATGSFYGGRYKNGQKRCQKCVIYLKYDGLHCPCCGGNLRTKPRHKILKEKFRKEMKESK